MMSHFVHLNITMHNYYNCHITIISRMIAWNIVWHSNESLGGGVQNTVTGFPIPGRRQVRRS